MSKQKSFRCRASRNRLGLSVVLAEMNVLPMVVDVRDPFSIRALSHSDCSRYVIPTRASVLVVLFATSQAQINDTVIGPVVVDMVNVLRGQEPVVPKPSHPMCFLHRAPDLENDVAMRVERCDLLAVRVRVPLTRCLSSKRPGRGVVINRIHQSRACYFHRSPSKLRRILTRNSLLVSAYRQAGGVMA